MTYIIALLAGLYVGGLPTYKQPIYAAAFFVVLIIFTFWDIFYSYLG